MEYIANTAALASKTISTLEDIPYPSVDANLPANLLSKCPRAAQTPLIESPLLAAKAGIGEVWVKDERARMGLGSFKALGAAYVIACDGAKGVSAQNTYVTASAGNHGLSLAAGAAAFGAKAVVYLAQTVPAEFEARLQALGADVRRAGAIYEESMAQAAEDAARNGWVLLSDSSWPRYTERPHRLMEGDLVLMEEAARQIPSPPTHIFLQAGVGGLAAASAAYARTVWGDGPQIVIVEPDAAPALFASIEAGSAQATEGPVSEMGRLDCKEPSLIALKGLARDANGFMTISEAQGHLGADACAKAGLTSTPSGAAGIAGLLAAARSDRELGLDQTARALVVLSEEASA